VDPLDAIAANDWGDPLDDMVLGRGFSSAPVLHPILGTPRPHYGQDLRAGLGTPVYAVADGYVGFAGWDDGFGNLVIIRQNP